MIQSGVIEMQLSDHELTFCSSKTAISKLNESYEISLRSMKNYSDENLLEDLRSKKFIDYSNYKYVDNAYQDFVTTVSSVANFVLPIRTLRVKSNTKPLFDIDVFNTFRNRSEHSNDQSRKLVKAILNIQSFYLKK